MKIVDIEDAKANLLRLVEEAASGEPFIIAKAGKPLVKVIGLEAPTSAQIRRIGFLKGQISVPDDFDEMGREEIEHLFYGDDK